MRKLLWLALLIPALAHGQRGGYAVLSPTPIASGCGAGYAHYVSLTVSSSSVSGGSDLTNYPATVTFNGAGTNSITLTNLKTVANSGQVQSVNGYDILFCSAASGGTAYNQELVSGTYVATTGAAEFYVQIPDLSASTSTVVYLFWGNSSITTDPSTCNTWSNGYDAVYHFGQSSLVLTDSSCNGQTMTAYGSPANASGQFGGAVYIPGSGNSVYINSPTAPTGSAARSVEAWMKLSSSPPSSTGLYFGYGDFGPTNGAFILLLSSSTSQFTVWTNGSNGAPTSGTGYPPNTAWHSYVMTATSPASVATGQIYLDGSALTMVSGGSTVAYSFPNTSLLIGGFGGSPGTAAPVETVDEFRVSTSARTAGWWTTQYANQSNPSTFFALGTIH